MIKVVLNEIIRWFLGSILATFLSLGFNLAILHSSQKANSFIDKLIIFLKGRANTYALSLRNFAGLWSSSLTGIETQQNLLITASDTLDNSKSLDMHDSHCMKSWFSSFWLFN